MLDGYKTYIGGIGLILTGIGKAMSDYYAGIPIDWQVIMGMIFAGISIMGFRSAIKK